MTVQTLDFGVVVIRVASKRSINDPEKSSGATRAEGMKFGLQMRNSELLLDISYAIASPAPAELAVTIDRRAVSKRVVQRYRATL